MRRRLWAFALAAVVAGAPAATTICLVACNSHETDATAHSSHQHSHAASTRIIDATIGPAPHTCDALFDHVLAIQQTFRSFVAPAVVAVVDFALRPPLDVAFVRRAGDIEQRPPGVLSLTTQLRV